MGLNCGCPAAVALPNVEIPACAESLGQIQKIIFQRVYSSAGVKNSIASPLIKASWTPLLVAADSTKIVVSPYIQGPTSEPGAPRTYGGGNATLGGIEIIIGREPGSFSAMILQTSQSVISELKKMMCENVGIYLVDENGRIGCLADVPAAPTAYMPIPIASLFVGDKKFGNLEEPDSNTIEFKFFPNYSDNFKILTPSDFNPLTELVFVAPTPTPTPSPTPTPTA